MIDWTKPIECVDGTPATYLRNTTGGQNILVDTPAHPYGMNLQNTERVYAPDGSTTPFPENPPLRNKEMKMIDKNKPVTAGGLDAKIVHTFDDGRMAVIVQDNPNVLTFPADGYLKGFGALANKVERIERWFSFNNYTSTSGAYPTLEGALRYKGTNRHIGITKIILENGVIVQTEIVNV